VQALHDEAAIHWMGFGALPPCFTTSLLARCCRQDAAIRQTGRLLSSAQSGLSMHWLHYQALSSSCHCYSTRHAHLMWLIVGSRAAGLPQHVLGPHFSVHVDLGPIQGSDSIKCSNTFKRLGLLLDCLL
jgi:hypothetical protein